MKILERDMESIIESDLINSGYFRGSPDKYDKTYCMDTENLINFIIATQKDKWEEYRKQHGERAKDTLITKIKQAIDDKGSLEVFRKPFKSHGVYFDLAYFKPASGMNESFQKKYQGNIVSVTRQVKYSLNNENSLDMVVFLNGLPIATLELKDKLTGSGYSVENAIKQYRKDRSSKEPLFNFGRCLVHFAVDEDMVYMTTHLKDENTKFLPFNKGHEGEAGNPPTYGFSSEYLWKEILQKDSILELIQLFIQMTDELDEDARPTGKKIIIFPRYHQLDAVRKLVAHSKENKCGNYYLIQHSAGSGKSNTISWLAHQLSILHDKDDVNVFDSIIVVTDRRILDRQLRTNVLAFEQNPGVVAGIERGSKQLKDELEAGTKIIVTTLQKFPYIEEQIKALPGKRFAVIIDEAHSSSSGEMSKSLKTVLKLNEPDDDPADYEDDVTWEDEIEQQLKARGRQPNISYFAFTATPKPKTLELFGTKQSDDTFKPFHLYPMKQAIQEGFIKDVLVNYTTYSTLLHLIKTITSDPEYDKIKASSLLKTYVELSKQTIEKKTKIIIDHFRDNCLNEIPDSHGNGQAKAMVVCSSRAQAVKYKKAIDKYLKDNKIGFKALVAFSGTVEDEFKNKYTEEGMNGFSEDKTANKFKESQYKILVVANKFQTGFDQPLLYAMYVNKKLIGVNAVQTISRLNRVCDGKKEPITIDFYNTADVIKKSFQDFYEDTTLVEASDPDKLYTYQDTLERFRYYTQDEIDAFCKIAMQNIKQQDKLNAVLVPVVERFKQDTKERKEEFRATLKTYVRVYSFLSQIISFSDVELEKLYIFGRILLRKLILDKGTLPYEVLQQVDLDKIEIKKKGTGIKLENGKGGKLKPGEKDPHARSIELKEHLSIIIREINDKYATDFNASDQSVADSLLNAVGQDQDFEAQVKNNPKENVWWAFQTKFNKELQNMIDKHFEFYKKINDNEDIKKDFMKQMFDALYNKMVVKPT
ncbi:MAG TPA: type I restriction endonuclease [Spirochaetota bacterium]|nr:type I restriction endonuclease [Spirochaetota bacterium]